MHTSGSSVLACLRLGFRNPPPPRLPSLSRPRRRSGLGAFAALALATLAGFASLFTTPARAQSAPPTVVYDTSGTNPAVHMTMERVPITNPDYFRQNQYTAVPNLAPSAPGTWSVVSLGNGIPADGKQPVAGGPLTVLNDGLAPASEAALAIGSVFSTGGNYGLLYDLGSVRPVTSITTYSASPAGNANGAGQNYQVWGSASLLPIVDGQDPYASGWQRIAIGAAHPYWGATVSEGGAYGIHLTSGAGSGTLGSFRYILFAMQDTGTPGAQGGQAMISEISITTPPLPPVPPLADLVAALDLPSDAPITRSGDASWFGQAATTHDGLGAARSGAITDGQATTLSLTTTGPDTLSFFWKVSSEAGYDHLRFSIDGIEKNKITGSVDWHQVSYVLPAGPHTLTWSYTKDLSGSTGADAGWVDQVVLTPTILLTPPASTGLVAGGTTTLTAFARDDTAVFQWYLGDTGDLSSPIPGATGASYTTPPLFATTSYWVRVTHVLGTADSPAATVSIITPPLITAGPAPRSLTAGAPAVLQVAASGGYLSYQWYIGATGDTSHPISGATGPLLVTPTLTATSAFWVRVTNAAGTADSASVNLTVVPPTVAFLHAGGANYDGQLGNGSSDYNPHPNPLGIATGVASVAAGDFHTVFIKTDGTLWAMGDNYWGQLGIGSRDSTAHPNPVQIATDVASVSAGYAHTVFVKTDGSLWSVGDNHNGQIGVTGSIRTILGRVTPAQIATDVVSVSAGYTHTLFVKTDGSLWGMGENSSGQLGDGSISSRYTPVQIATGVASASAGSSHSLFVKTDGSLWAMGNNYRGQLGTGGNDSHTTPVQIATGVASASAASSYSLFIKADGSLWSMGSNESGQLGTGSTIDHSWPVQIATGVASVCAGDGPHALFVKTDGSLWGMGNNSFGELGIATDYFGYYSTPYYYSTPVLVASGVVRVAVGRNHTLILASSAILAPVIPVQSTDVTTLADTQTGLFVVAAGTAPFNYQWYEGETGDTSSPLVGETLATLATPPLTVSTRFWVRVTNPAGATDSATIQVTVTLAPGFATWAADAGLSGPAALADADPDGDGTPNLLEYAFGTSPTAANSGIAPTSSITVTDGQAFLVFTHRRLKSALLTYAYQSSSDLVEWTTLGSAVYFPDFTFQPVAPVVVNADVDGDGLVELVSLAVPIPATTDARLFLRLSVLPALPPLPPFFFPGDGGDIPQG
jgi:alpha-tubulin suppressor-like RCC1 family protein